MTTISHDESTSIIVDDIGMAYLAHSEPWPSPSPSPSSSSSSSSSSSPAEEARGILAFENEALAPDGEVPFAPMMTYQKYLTMQVSILHISMNETNGVTEQLPDEEYTLLLQICPRVCAPPLAHP